jgi:hypothetical protein
MNFLPGQYVGPPPNGRKTVFLGKAKVERNRNKNEAKEK